MEHVGMGLAHSKAISQSQRAMGNPSGNEAGWDVGWAIAPCGIPGQNHTTSPN